MYNPPEDIRELRAKGLPWVVAVCVLVIIVLAGLLFYYAATETLPSMAATTPAAAFLNYEIHQVDAVDEDSTFAEDLERSRQTSAPLPEPSEEIPSQLPSTPGAAPKKFLHAAVTCRNEYCAEIGRDVLIRGGNAVDSAIATVVCMGAVHPHATGFGGGMVMLVHNRTTNETVSIDAYSAAPRSVDEDTFISNPNLASYGYSSIATPGFLHGIWTAFKRYGSARVAWQDLLMPTVHLLERGIPADNDFVAALQSKFNEIISERSMSSAYNLSLDEGQIYRDSIHAAFLRRLAITKDPADLFYRGEVANQIGHEMKQRGGLLTKADLASFETKVNEPLVTILPGGFILKGPRSPSVYKTMTLVMEAVLGHYQNLSSVSMDVSYIRNLIKAQRLAAIQLDQIGDPEFSVGDPVVEALQDVQENTTDAESTVESSSNELLNELPVSAQHGSVGSHINVVDTDNLAVSLSSTLNGRFGSLRRSMKGGFVWNNEMSSFTIRDKENSDDVHVNAIEGRKRPRSGMSPFMVFDEKHQLVLVGGVTGSFQSVMAAAQVLLNYLFLKKDLTSAVNSPRMFAVQGGTTFEAALPMDLLTDLWDETSISPLLSPNSQVHCLESLNGSIASTCDLRDVADVCAKGF
ncbi:hypothetical protein Q1695_002132 [Nippostrongylus brasiliensis]|nr:hypothetical protein Q1695_002132 [Nippostrongylus brasiliensis]